MRFKIVLILVSILTFNTSFSFVTVGASGCDVTTIIAALNSGDSEIRLVKGNFTTNIGINTSVEIIGGYDSCAAASANTPPTDKTFIFANAAPGPSVIKINLNNTDIRLQNLYITGGRKDASVFNGGHGIEVGGASGSVIVDNSTIADNRSDKGGGIYVSGINDSDNKFISVIDSVIFGNSAFGFSAGNGFGGGVYCGGAGSRLTIKGNSTVTANFSENGGGIAAEFGCYVQVSSGIDVNFSSSKRGVMNNQATLNGGGVYLNNGAYFILNPTFTSTGNVSGSSEPATLAFNSADLKGGGIYAQFNSRIEIRDSLIQDNTATDGGGFYITTDSKLDIDRTGLDCWNPGSCVVISNNEANKGGVLHLSLSNELTAFSNIAHARIFDNRANEGVVTYITGITNEIPTTVYINSSFIYNNGNFGLNGYSDFNIFTLSNNAQINLSITTIADNNIIANGEVLRSIDSSFYIRNSIVHNTEKVIAQFSTQQSVLDCLVVNEESSFTGTNTYVQDPGFVNSSINDYHLSSSSFAIDLCDNGSGFFFNLSDTEYDLRGIDILNVMNIGGPYDAGADEYNDHEAVFKNGFE